jgi:predicted esterase
MARWIATFAVALLLTGAFLASFVGSRRSRESRAPAVRAVASATTAEADDASDREPAAINTPCFDVPRLDRLTIDGNPAGWADRGLAVNVLANASGKIQPREDIDASLRLGWNDDGLLALVTVHDDLPFERSGPLAGGDAIHLFVATSVGSGRTVHVAIAPGVDPSQASFRTVVVSTGPRSAPRTSAPSVRAMRTKIAGGYVVETLIPWSQLDITPADGREIGFQCEVDDADSDTQGSKLVWYPSLRTARDSSKMHRLRLVDDEAAPAQVQVAAFGDYPHLHRTRVTVVADASLTGQTVELCKPLADDETDDDRWAIKTGKLEPDFIRPDLASLNLSLPMPKRGQGYGVLDVYVDGRRVGVVDLPDPGNVAEWELPNQQFVFQPCVFSGRVFPEGDFEDPSYVEDLVGPYEVKTTFYDADFHPVATAEKPGRYGAVIAVHLEDGRTLKRYCTLFREPKDISWRNAEMPFTVKLPSEFGISPRALKLQSRSVNEYFKGLLGNEGLNRDEDTAVLLAGLFETKPTDRPLLRNNPAATDRKWWATLKRQLNEPGLPHLTYLPTGYDAHDATKRWPLILFLHGKGERGEDLNELKEAGLCQKLEYDARFRQSLPAIVVAPQCPANGWWSSYDLARLLDEVQSQLHVDPDRVYVTGMSMGGYGAWALATEFPDRFAAIAPCCGGGDVDDATRLKDLPVWTFHGDADPIVPFWESQRMVDALKKLGDEVRFTVYPRGGHDAWTESYANPELSTWLLAHRRSDRTSFRRPAVAVNAAATQPVISRHTEP